MTMRQGSWMPNGPIRASPHVQLVAQVTRQHQKLPESSGAGSKRSVIWGIPV